MFLQYPNAYICTNDCKFRSTYTKTNPSPIFPWPTSRLGTNIVGFVSLAKEYGMNTAVAGGICSKDLEPLNFYQCMGVSLLSVNYNVKAHYKAYTLCARDSLLEILVCNVMDLE